MIYQLHSLDNQNDAQRQALKAASNIGEGQKFKKASCIQFLDALLQNLESIDERAASKTMTMHILKQMNYLSDAKFFTILSNHKLFQFLQRQAKTVDPKKRLAEKGSKKFSKQKQLGIEYMRVMLECMAFWAEKYGKASNSLPSRFKKATTQLKSNGIQLPKQYHYLDVTKVKSKRKGRQDDAETHTPKPISQTKGVGMMEGGAGGNLWGQLMFSKDKIDIYMGTLDEEEDQERLKQQIHSNHSKFASQFQRYTQKMPEVQKQSQQVQSIYFKIFNFLEKQSQHYRTYIMQDDYQSYLVKVKQLFQSSEFPQSANNKLSMKKLTSKGQKNYVGMTESADVPRYETPGFQQVLRKNQPKSAESDPRLNSIETDVGKNLTYNIFTKMEERSKSRTVGFKDVKRQLQKEKQNVRRSPLRRASRSPHTNRSISVNRSMTTRDKINPIFSNPPNPSVDPKQYEGQTVYQNRQLYKILYNIKKDQGARRFKISNFREKNPLFENQHLQVGYKSHVIYEKINNLDEFICLNIFIGNKTDQVIKDFRVEYKGDSNQLLYANPKSVDTLIPAGYQNKHDLMICPIKLPYSLMTMYISYTYGNSNIHTSIVLPNSAMKFASYMNINRHEYEKSWQGSEKYKTLPFQLCKYFAPDNLHKWISSLGTLTEYSEFNRQGSQIDYQLYCNVILLQKYEAILKINIRPNMKVVLQLGVMDANKQAHQYFKFYLETLQLIMKQTDV